MEEALVAHLLAFGTLAALVGQRITWATRPQASALPAVVLSKVDGIPDYTMAGPSGLVAARIQVDSWGTTYAEARGVGRQVEARLSGLDVSIGDGNSPEVLTHLSGGFMQGDRDDFELGAGGADLHRVSQDYIIWHGRG